jgi:hypothetical protein
VADPDVPAPEPPPTPTVRGVEYKGAPLDAAKGPGLGCFWSQLVVLGILIVLTPLSVAWNWPAAVSAGLLVGVLLLLLFAGQTVIFLLRLVAADRRAAGRRRPLGSATKTVGELEDAGTEVTTPGGQPQGDERQRDEPPDGGVRE